MITKEINITPQQVELIKQMRPIGRQQLSSMQTLVAHLRKLADITRTQLHTNDQVMRHMRGVTSPVQQAKFLM